MDTPEDFLFLDARVALEFNPYQEGEYLVLKYVVGEMHLRVVYRDFCYCTAQISYYKENLATPFKKDRFELNILRINLGGKLYCVNLEGAPSELSEQQDWKIHHDYRGAGYVENFRSGIKACVCTYPLFRSWKNYIHPNEDPDLLWDAATCLVDDHGREVDNCPNCHKKLTKVFGRQLNPIAYKNRQKILPECFNCQYYSSNHLLLCAVYPSGPVDDICPDYSM